MIDLRRDFGFLGRLFGIPRKWLSQVGAFCSSWTVTSRIITLKIPSWPDPSDDPIELGIDEDALDEYIQDEISDLVGNGLEEDADTGKINVLPVSEGGISVSSNGVELEARFDEDQEVTVLTRFDDSGAVGVLYSRTLTFNKYGQLTNIGEEEKASDFMTDQ